MNETVASLYKRFKIQHTMDPKAVLLTLPLHLVPPSEYVNLFSILALLEHGLIKTLVYPLPKPKRWGDQTLKHIQQFYLKLNQTVQSALGESKNPTPNPICITLPTYEQSYFTPASLIQFIQNKPIYKTLSAYLTCPVEFSIFIAQLTTPASEELLTSMEAHLKKLTPENTYKQSIEHLVSILIDLGFFKHFEQPQRFIFQQLIELKKGKFEQEDKKINDYLIEVFTLLVTKIPTTLGSLLINLGLPMNLYQELQPKMKELLKSNLNQIPGLTPEDWPKLVYYTLLFVLNKAKTIQELSLYSYAGKELPKQLEELATKEATYLKPFIEKVSECTIVFNNVYLASLTIDLNRELPSIDSHLLTILCFENCPHLRTLFHRLWGMEDKKTSALYPSSNSFLLGFIFSPNNDGKPAPISNEDLNRIYELIKLTKIIKGKSSTADTEIQFELLKSSIQKQKLYEAVNIEYLTKLAPHFFAHPKINHHAIYNFLVNQFLKSKDWNINSLNYYKDFFKLIDHEKTKEIIIRIFSANLSNLIVKPTSKNALQNQSERINHVQKGIEHSLSGLPILSNDEQQSLKKKWLEVKLLFLDILDQKIQELLQKEVASHTEVSTEIPAAKP